MGLNWNQFKAKFDGKEQSEFELLSYILFCHEHGNKIGLFRFKNQAGIETEPILTFVDGKNVGFQAKFIDTKLSEKKSILIEAIQVSKDKNPELNKILFYTNQEFTESSKKGKKEPKYKKEIEDFATTLNVEIEWRVPSHFEIQLKNPENKYLLDCYFLSDKESNAITFITRLQDSTDFYLSNKIKNQIQFHDNIIKIERKEYTTIEANIKKEGILIVCGDGGNGKTALLKDFYDKNNPRIPFYVFKAIDFSNITNINNFFKAYGEFYISDFIEAHKYENDKIILIDSAEKLSDIEDIDTLKEFISILSNNHWKIIFTTRNSYLSDLNTEIRESTSYQPDIFEVKNIDPLELKNIATNNNFKLPENEKLLNLICNPFYLNEYLQTYDNVSPQISYNDFKDILWKKKIYKGHLKELKQKCFIDLVREKVDKNLFHLETNKISEYNEVLKELESDEIIQYDKTYGKFFIAHDIYEEWALDKIIQSTFLISDDYNTFYNSLGKSLSIRRAFRAWISNKLSENIESIEKLIKCTLTANNIESFWKEELLISILLSNYSDIFFKENRVLIIEKELFYLRKIISLLKTACQDIDTKRKQYFKEEELIPLSWLIIPKGSGWKNTIMLLYEERNSLKLEDTEYILPLLTEWKNSEEDVETARIVGLLTLHFYNLIQFDDSSYCDDDYEKMCFQIINNVALYIKDELSDIFEDVIKNSWIKHGNPYYDFCSELLAPSDYYSMVSIYRTLPSYIYKIADLFWYKKEEEQQFDSILGISFERNNNPYPLNRSFDYNRKLGEPNAKQTPLYWLLRFDFVNSLRFIVSFLNKVIVDYAESTKINEVVESITIHFDDNTQSKQYINNTIWLMNMGDLVSNAPALLQSIHLALEENLSLRIKESYSETIEKILLWALKESKSASISAIIADLVIIYPDKLYNVAKVLFKTKEFFIYDVGRASRRHFSNKFKDSPYSCLEHMITSYLLVKKIDEGIEVFNKREKELLSIIDEHYKNIPEIHRDTFRFILGRIDKRKFNITTENQGDKTLIMFNPDLDEDLKVMSKETTDYNTEFYKYSALKLWAHYRLEGNGDYSNIYDKYEQSPLLALAEMKDALNSLEKTDDEHYYSMYSCIPAYVCSLLIKDYKDLLNKEDKKLCNEMILKYAELVINKDYYPQIGDGVEFSIKSLPYLFSLFPQDKVTYKRILLFTLLNETPLGAYKRCCDYAIEAVDILWLLSSEDANEVFIAYLNVIIEFDKYRLDYFNKRKKEFGNHTPTSIVLDAFVKSKYAKDFPKYESLPDVTTLDLEILDIAFHLIPLNTQDVFHLDFIKEILPMALEKLMRKEKYNSFKDVYALRIRFFKYYSAFLLSLDKQKQNEYIAPIINHFQISNEANTLLEKIIENQKNTDRYDQFWGVWNSLYSIVIGKTKEYPEYTYSKEILKTYLFSDKWTSSTEQSCNYLKKENSIFFEHIIEDIGEHPSVLYAIVELLNGIGSVYIKDGIRWISQILNKYFSTHAKTVDANTQFRLEQLIQKYINENRTQIKKDRKEKEKVIVILNFLVEKESVSAYLLRESII